MSQGKKTDANRAIHDIEAERIESFWSRVTKTETCWLYQGNPSHKYAFFYWNGGSAPAYRFSWILHHGRDIAPGIFVCHKCDVPRCVRPDHLFEGTHKENVLDMMSKDRRQWKVTIADARAIRALYATGGFTYRQIGEVFGIGKDYAGQIIRNEARPEVEDARRKLLNGEDITKTKVLARRLLCQQPSPRGRGV